MNRGFSNSRAIECQPSIQVVGGSTRRVSGNILRQQFVDAIDRMIGDALKHVVQVTLRIHVVEFVTFHMTVNNCVFWY